MRSGSTPALMTLTESCDSPPAPAEANGGPLSERSTLGSPNSRNAASSTGQTCLVSVHFIAWQRNRYRLCASHSVSGSQWLPLRVRNQPLKSMHHTSLGPPHCENGALEGGLRRRNLRATVRPSRSNSAPIVLAAGHLVAGQRRSR